MKRAAPEIERSSKRLKYDEAPFQKIVGGKVSPNFDATKIDDIISTYVEAKIIPGAYYIVSNGLDLNIQRGFGLANRENKVPYKATTPAVFYSMTKALVTTCIMMLFEEGKIDLDLPIGTYIPELSKDKMSVLLSVDGKDVKTEPLVKPITTRHLLTHSSGIGYGWGTQLQDDLYKEKIGDTLRVDRTTSKKEFINGIAATPLRFQPGSGWLYGYSLDIAGFIVEAISGKNLGAFMKERIFDPLGMKSSTFEPSEEMKNELAEQFENVSKFRMKHQNYHESYDLQWHSGGGGIHTTVEDYSKFLTMILNEGVGNARRLMKKETVDYMTKENHLEGGKLLLDLMSEDDVFAEYFRGSGHSLWGYVVKDKSKAMHPLLTENFGGWGGYASTVFWVDWERHYFFIFLTQLRPSSSIPIRQQLMVQVSKAMEEYNRKEMDILRANRHFQEEA